MRIIYNNYIDDYTLSAQDYFSADYKVTNIQNTHLGRVWRSKAITNLFSYGDCEETISPTLDGIPSGLSDSTWARSAVESQEGSYSWVLTKTSAAAAGDAVNYLNDNYSETTDMHRLTAGNYYRFDFWMFSDVATLSNASVIFQEYYSAAWNNTIEFNPGQVSTWENFSSSIKINDNTTGVRILIKIDTSEVVSKSLYLDDIKFHLENRISFDAGTGINPTVVSILNHNLSSSANIRLQGNSSDNFVSPTVDEYITWASGNIIEFVSLSSQRYWSILFDDPDNSDGYIDIGRLYLSTYIEFSKGAKYGLKQSKDSFSSYVQNPSGQLYGSKNAELKGYDISLAMLSQSDKENLDSIFDSVSIHNPFILVINNSLISTFPMLYCHFTKAFALNYDFQNFWTGSLSVMEVK